MSGSSSSSSSSQAATPPGRAEAPHAGSDSPAQTAPAPLCPDEARAGEAAAGNTAGEPHRISSARRRGTAEPGSMAAAASAARGLDEESRSSTLLTNVGMESEDEDDALGCGDEKCFSDDESMAALGAADVHVEPCEPASPASAPEPAPGSTASAATGGGLANSGGDGSTSTTSSSSSSSGGGGGGGGAKDAAAASQPSAGGAGTSGTDAESVRAVSGASGGMVVVQVLWERGAAVSAAAEARRLAMMSSAASVARIEQLGEGVHAMLARMRNHIAEQSARLEQFCAGLADSLRRALSDEDIVTLLAHLPAVRQAHTELLRLLGEVSSGSTSLERFGLETVSLMTRHCDGLVVLPPDENHVSTIVSHSGRLAMLSQTPAELIVTICAICSTLPLELGTWLIDSFRLLALSSSLFNEPLNDLTLLVQNAMDVRHARLGRLMALEMFACVEGLAKHRAMIPAADRVLCRSSVLKPSGKTRVLFVLNSCLICACDKPAPSGVKRTMMKGLKMSFGRTRKTTIPAPEPPPLMLKYITPLDDVIEIDRTSDVSFRIVYEEGPKAKKKRKTETVMYSAYSTDACSELLHYLKQAVTRARGSVFRIAGVHPKNRSESIIFGSSANESLHTNVCAHLALLEKTPGLQRLQSFLQFLTSFRPRFPRALLGELDELIRLCEECVQRAVTVEVALPRISQQTHVLCNKLVHETSAALDADAAPAGRPRTSTDAPRPTATRDVGDSRTRTSTVRQ